MKRWIVPLFAALLALGARGFMGRQTAANVRVLMAARLFERGILEPLAMRFVDMNRRFQNFPYQVRAIGTAAILDPLTMRPIPAEGDTISVNEMLPDYTARGMGSLRGVDRDAQFNKLLMLFQLSTTNHDRDSVDELGSHAPAALSPIGGPESR